MKLNMHKILNYTLGVLFIIISTSSSRQLFSNEGEREIGKVLFKSESSGEVMVISSVETPSLFVVKGSLLNIGKGEESVKVSVIDICGLYIRCSVAEKGDKKIFSVKEGDGVFYSDSSNASVRYSDVKKILSALIKLYEDFIYRVESSDEPVIISENVERFASDLEKILPEMERLNSKYPELKNFYSEPPPELKYESENLQRLEPALTNVFFKINLYRDEPAVKNSISRLQKVLSRMRNSVK